MKRLGNLIYIVTENVDGQDWYVAEYSIEERQVGVTDKLEKAMKLKKKEADYVAEYFGMASERYFDQEEA